VQVLQPALQNPFDAPQRSIGELMCYDPKRSPFRMLKVAGQVIYAQTNEYFLTDGTNGIHVTTRNNDFFEIGELVEAVGIAGFGGPNAELKEAIVRKTGRASLPNPSTLSPDQLLQASSAGTLVQVEATLLNQWRDTTDYVLELQSGFVAFRARLDGRHHSLSLPPYGSRLDLTGVYVPHGAFAGDDAVSSFELLLHSPAGIRVLATPPWWTLKRVLALAGVLAALLCLVLLWNKQLHRQVFERGRQLEAEIRHRQSAELQHAAESERSRIARDLHDELGTGLTEVSLLASAGLVSSVAADNNNDRLRIIADKARGLVSGLDVIVWAIDPKRNTLQSFADYVISYVKEFLSASDIVCRFSIPIECDGVTLSGTVRHNLFLAIKEALNNVVRHASAKEVDLQITPSDKFLEIAISDNGRGFALNTIRRGNGITNFRERLDKLHGQCTIESQPGGGTTVKFSVPLRQETN
jgi:signal transduction histidine kinase